MGSDPVIVYVSSDDDDDHNDGRKKRAFRDDGSDDECLVLDSDPEKELLVADDDDRNGEVDEDEESDDLIIVNERGKVACRDYPHPRHLCANYPFNASRHEVHCSLCHCYVCDIPAPCRFWGNGKLTTDHCHSTDKGANWKDLRESFKENNMVVQNQTQSNPQLQNSIPSHPANSGLVTAAQPISSASSKVQRKNQSSMLPVQKSVSPHRSTVVATTMPPRTILFSPKMSVVKTATEKVVQPAKTASEKVKKKTQSNMQPAQSTMTTNRHNSVLVTTASPKSSLVTQQKVEGDSGTLTAKHSSSSIKRPRAAQSRCLNTDKSNNLPLKNNRTSGPVQHTYNLRR